MTEILTQEQQDQLDIMFPKDIAEIEQDAQPIALAIIDALAHEFRTWMEPIIKLFTQH